MGWGLEGGFEGPRKSRRGHGHRLQHGATPGTAGTLSASMHALRRPARQGVRLSAGAPGAASRRSVLSPRPDAGSRGLEGWTGCRSRGGEHSSPPPRAVEEVTGQPLTSQKPARLSGMGVVEGRVMGWARGGFEDHEISAGARPPAPARRRGTAHSLPVLDRSSWSGSSGGAGR